jgi:5'(3')-deoxyribonucleotidase
MKVFIDMDEVLADFHGSYIHLCAKNKWDCPIKELGEWVILPDDHMKKLDCYWWSKLPWTKWGSCLFSLCQTIFGADNLWLCSTPTEWHGCRDGKREWVESHLGKTYVDRLILTGHKELLAKPDRLLIDDRVRNCERFVAEGGHAYVFPAPSNFRHKQPFSQAILCHELMQMREVIARKVA